MQMYRGYGGHMDVWGHTDAPILTAPHIPTSNIEKTFLFKA